MASPKPSRQQFDPMPLAVLTIPFDHPDWIFELKYDGFRALAHVDSCTCSLVSRNGNAFKSFADLCTWIGGAIRGSTVLDGEVVHLGEDGRPRFYELMRRRGPFQYCAFDILWHDGDDLRRRPLLERKAQLRQLVPSQPSPVIYVDHVVARGSEFFSAVCGQDLEGIVAKLAHRLYTPDWTTWVKVKNKAYTQAEGRREFFEGVWGTPRNKPPRKDTCTHRVFISRTR